MLGFDAERLEVVTLTASGQNDEYIQIARHEPAQSYRFCLNAGHGVCNWLAPKTGGAELCVACSLNRTIPNLQEPGNLAAWGEFELAKKRLIYQLLRFGLPVDATHIGRHKLTFDFARDTTTGHLDGVISVDMLEADSVWREQQKQLFQEPYRSLLGHLRHESGHFYWMLLVEGTGHLDRFRSLFGDDTLDYSNALASYHDTGPVANWQELHVSAYACAHPWEDWAETWAHYLHMVDALDTSEEWGLEPRARGLVFGSFWPFKISDIYREETFEALMERWIPLTLSLNSLSRSMGHADYYPFVISDPVRKKLGFVHEVIRNGGAQLGQRTTATPRRPRRSKAR